MFEWNDDYKWMFEKGAISDFVGPNDANTGIFEGHPYRGLAKEILQNSLDAKNPALPDSEPVIVEFALFDVPAGEIPGLSRLNEVIQRCSEAFPEDTDDGQTVAEWKRKSNLLIQQETIPVLKISDYNTTGLSGVTKFRGTGWSTLVRQTGATNKSNGQGGSHGVGKFAPYSFSALRTVLYATKNTENETAFQGKTILTSFEENGGTWRNVGVFGNSVETGCPAIFDMNEVPEVFRRDEYGTDVIAVGFESDDDWMEQIALSILQYCFYVIYDGRLIVRIKAVDRTLEFRKDNLNEQMVFFEQWHKDHIESKEFDFTAPRFFSILQNPKMKHFIETPSTIKRGEVGLYLLVDPSIEDKAIYEMRRSGMGICEDRGWKIGARFNGIFIATGNNAVDSTPEHNIDSFLRKCEGQAHNEWSSAIYKGNKKEADAVIGNIHKWILGKIRGEMPNLDVPSHDAFGLSDYLQNNFSVGDNKEEENAFLNYEPLSMETKAGGSSKSKPVVSTVKSNSGTKKKKKKDEKQEKKPGGGGNPKPNNRRGKKTGTVSEVEIKGVVTPFDDKTGQYVVSFSSDKNLKNLSLQINVNSDDQNNGAAEISKAFINGREARSYGGKVLVGDIRKGERVTILLQLDQNRRCGLEVKAYAEQ